MTRTALGGITGGRIDMGALFFLLSRRGSEVFGKVPRVAARSWVKGIIVLRCMDAVSVFCVSCSPGR